MTCYLITGGAGFIGSHLAHALVAQGAQVRVLDNFTTGRRENLQAVESQVEIVEGDIRDLTLVQRAMQGVDYVLHQAARVSVVESLEDPHTTHAVNLSGTLNVLLEARAAGVRRVVIASSSAVYGDGPVPAREDQTLLPLSPYAVTKLAGEAYARTFTSALGVETVALRYFNVYGPRQDPSSEYSGVIARFAEALLSGKAATIYGDGEQTRDFIFVDDVVHANLLACRATDASGRAVNVGTGVGRTVRELLEFMAQQAGVLPHATFAPARPGEIRHSCSDPDQARDWMGFRAQMSLPEGLGKTIAWYRESAPGSKG
jgi:nucleoside-diphosphate-sugar epimerase